MREPRSPGVPANFMHRLLHSSKHQVIYAAQGGCQTTCQAKTATTVPPMKISPPRPGSAFRIAIVVSLLTGALLMFGSLTYAATHLQVTM